MSVLAIDPGLRGCGCAIFAFGDLYRAAYVPSGSDAHRADAWRSMADKVFEWGNDRPFALDEVAIECPTLYNGRSAKGDGRDLIDLAAVVGGICALFRKCPVKVYQPAEWK